MQCIQLDFFRSDEESEIVALRKEISAVSASANKVRKGTYARIGELSKEVRDLKERLAIIERHICKPESIELNFSI